MARIFALTLLVLTVTHGCCGFTWPWDKPTPTSTSWKDIRITLPNQHIISQSKYFFDPLPTTQSQAVTEKWTSISNGDCTNGGMYNGFRYIPADAPSIALLFNNLRAVAGLQILYDKAQIQTPGKNGYKNSYKFDTQPLINTEMITINGETKEYYVITAYYENPKTICSSSKSEAEVKSDGFGNELFFQNGSTPNSVMEVPQKRDEANKQGWNNNRCLPLNGNHNFYHTEQWQSTNCNEMLPVWLFFGNDDIRNGYGYTVPGMDNSPRMQHPPGAIVQYVLNQDNNTCAKETADNIGFSNMNVHFVPNPYTITCKLSIPQWIKNLCPF